MDRRAFLAASGSGLLLAGCAGPRVLAPAPCRAFADIGAERLLRASAGLRPYRDDGFVVRRDALGPKALVHNYGHGGGGITLSWGSSALAVEAGPRTGPYAVIGAGVMGLTTARLLQERGGEVTIYSAELPQETTSWVAGGQVRPVGIGRRYSQGKQRQLDAAMAISWERFSAMAGPRYGVRWVDTYEREGGERSDIEERYMPVHGRANGLQRYRTMYVETPRFLSELLAQFLADGGRMVVRRFASLEEVAGLDEPVVFNCTGVHARQLVGDTGLVPARGQLAWVERQAVDFAYVLPEGYCFPRDDAVLLGGTWERGQWSRTPEPATIERIMAGHREIQASRCFS
ncbi:FAD-dependent oxidoreductase [Sphingomicrobium aestuariivivum]|uniref:FAD-dependent oxidoreductase n=1 Tax=Sphingomicrobium aestuariivivum TaxID=1582356 RepID=UPI001FD6E397|nr:FAD-dependent oxidoreductase [Sphingomicrobium aestuariivivum]MCJ8190837.1 FAD-binding oxidoreductase [Sphingomicrobium aestuariivivum]